MPMQKVKAFFQTEEIIIFFFCLAVLFGPALTILFENNELQYHNDCTTYLGLAHFDMNQVAVRRYRIIVPFLAHAINYCFGGIFNKLAPTYYTGDFALHFSFFFVNSLIFCAAGALVYKFIRAYNTGRIAAVTGLLVLLSCRYTSYYTGLPLVESLFFLTIAMLLYGIKTQHRGYIISALFLGPFSKESFIFIAPVIFFVPYLPKFRMAIYLLLSGLLIFGFRFMYDRLNGFDANQSITADISHIYNIPRNLPVLLSAMGMYKIWSNVGFWILIPMAAIWWRRSHFSSLYHRLSGYMLVLLISVLLQMLLSGSQERMFYIFMPVICLIVALSADELKKHLTYGKNKFI